MVLLVCMVWIFAVLDAAHIHPKEISLNDEGQIQYYGKHKYPPYYFTRKYFPSFSAMTIDNFDSDHFMSSSSSDDSSDSKDIKYSDRTQLIAFILAFFLGQFGAGRFYVGSYYIATTKLVYFLFVIAFR
eukprot:128844_1